MKRAVLCLIGVWLVALLLGTSAVYAQGDSDGDGLPDTADRCPDRPGPRENGGCPLDSDGDGVDDDQDACPTQPGVPEHAGCPAPVAPPPAPPGDRDGDGVTDDIDFCLDQPGPLENGGCPLPEATPVPTAAPPLPDLPAAGACLLATQGYDGVNVRAFPSMQAAVVASLDPFQLYPILTVLTLGSETWYGIAQGWVAGWVVRTGGDCAGVPAGAADVAALGLFIGWQPISRYMFGDGSVRICDGSVIPGDGSVVPGDGSADWSAPQIFDWGCMFTPPGGQFGLLLPASEAMLGDGSVRPGEGGGYDPSALLKAFDPTLPMFQNLLSDQGGPTLLLVLFEQSGGQVLYVLGVMPGEQGSIVPLLSFFQPSGPLGVVSDEGIIAGGGFGDPNSWGDPHMPGGGQAGFMLFLGATDDPGGLPSGPILIGGGGPGDNVLIGLLLPAVQTVTG